MVMTKSDLVVQVAQETKLTKADAERAINAVFSGIQGALKKGKEARFIGFGSFAVHQSSAREGRNPRTGEKIKIKASGGIVTYEEAAALIKAGASRIGTSKAVEIVTS